ncbi:MAG: peptidase S41 [Burkholderiaceae bacterium]|nr:peptidase S41 [Rhodoferax sp.]MCP5284148.1 peptidase S41 [Burkholderiaceae bacterium]
MTIRHLAALCASAVLLTACGGGGGGTPPPLSCSVADQKTWLRDYFDDWYLWYALAPRPAPAGFDTVQAYFDASLFGGNATFPADRYSYFGPTEDFQRFFGDGITRGYGLFVAGVEVEGRPDLPLRIRFIEPQSDAATKGLLRGEQILSINGRSASEIIAADDYDVLVPDNVGDQLQLVVRGAGGDRSVTLVARDYALTPVTSASVVDSPLGRKVGYVVVKDMINQVDAPLDAAFAQFRAQGVTEVVLDLRYNGGGFVSTGATVASYVGGARTSNQTYVQLLYSDQHAASNRNVRFTAPANAVGLSRVYVLSGPRTCSASEQVINGLRGAGIDVVQIGDVTCGKPVGFNPQDGGCGQTYSVVTFESVNARNEGRYFDGLVPQCDVADDLDHPLGSTAEGLLSAALSHADFGVCPAAARRAQPLSAARADGAGPRRMKIEPGEFQGMFTR